MKQRICKSTFIVIFLFSKLFSQVETFDWSSYWLSNDSIAHTGFSTGGIQYSLSVIDSQNILFKQYQGLPFTSGYDSVLSLRLNDNVTLNETNVLTGCVVNSFCFTDSIQDLRFSLGSIQGNDSISIFAFRNGISIPLSSGNIDSIGSGVSHLGSMTFQGGSTAGGLAYPFDENVYIHIPGPLDSLVLTNCLASGYNYRSLVYLSELEFINASGGLDSLTFIDQTSGNYLGHPQYRVLVSDTLFSTNAASEVLLKHSGGIHLDKANLKCRVGTSWEIQDPLLLATRPVYAGPNNGNYEIYLGIKFSSPICMVNFSFLDLDSDDPVTVYWSDSISLGLYDSNSNVPLSVSNIASLGNNVNFNQSSSSFSSRGYNIPFSSTDGNVELQVPSCIDSISIGYFIDLTKINDFYLGAQQIGISDIQYQLSKYHGGGADQYSHQCPHRYLLCLPTQPTQSVAGHHGYCLGLFQFSGVSEYDIAGTTGGDHRIGVAGRTGCLCGLGDRCPVLVHRYLSTGKYLHR